jgi:lactonase
VWDQNGDLVETVKVPQNLDKPETYVTNLAIKPGTRDGYIVVGGQAGGFVYTFKALADGISQSNGGGAVYPNGA